MVPLLGCGNIVIDAPSEERAKANEGLQSLLLRMLALTPPGKLRLTLIDPVGYGQGFSHLMKLPAEVRGDMAWHEPRDVERELTNLTQILAGIVQKYLTNEYPDIVAYNRHAGEVSEPYRILAIANLPAGLTDRLWQRLLSLAESGPRAGIHIAATIATDLAMPHGCQAKDLLTKAIHVRYAERSLWTSSVSPLDGSIELDSVDEERAAAITAYVQKEAKHADQVKVGFSKILPDSLWTDQVPIHEQDCLSVPIGRFGARDILQFEVQKGTTHHALIGGQTGSGKSVLLHVLILGIASRFKPEDVELYLIDFKEGVEFQPYKDLPHVRVVATQAEREFALNVLKGLAREIGRRGESFRQSGVQDIRGWRAKNTGPMPFIFLLIDEFQVLLDRNDRIASQGKGLLDDFVRRGRSFGIHVVLATQSLASVEIEQSTLNQLGIRIGLRMGENDSYRILAKDNDSAAHLTRPGEAIYNDGGGQRGRDRKFQVAFIDRPETLDRLAELKALAEKVGWSRTPIVFDGASAAQLDADKTIVQALSTQVQTLPKAIPMYFGEPMSVDEGATRGRLRRQGRSNVLLVGSDEEDALATFLAACATSCLLMPKDSMEIVVLDLTNVDSPRHGELEVLRALPQSVKVWKINQKQSAPTIEALHEEVLARIADMDADRPRKTVLFGVFGYQRLRDVQKDGLTVPSLARKFAKVLQEGPDLGIHTLIWADSHGALMRGLENRDLEEFETRVLLQGGDASRLITDLDKTAWAALRRHYGILYERDSPEESQKFKCYTPESVKAVIAKARKSP